jgi:prephenate dehydrogenase
MTVHKAAIVGVGLIGGSLAAAWRAAGFAQNIVGLERNPSAAAAALKAGLVDEVVSTVPADAELVAICTSSDQIATCIADLRDHTGVLFDVGSVKAPIIDNLLESPAGVPERFVPAHPIAGSELSGPMAAQADLFQGATVVITPLANTDLVAQQLVRAAWQAVGAHVVELSPEQHDEMLAVTSHLPHLLAFAFMQQVDAKQIPFSGGGFRDFTRIAAANPELWWRILSLNKSQVLAAAAQFKGHLQQLLEALANNDADAGLDLLNAAAALRQSVDLPGDQQK